MSWISGIAGIFKRRPAPPRASRSGERVRRVSDPLMAVCLFCGRTASVQPFGATVQLDCSDCGPCEVTVEAMRLLRADANLREAVRRQVRRHLDTGAERPLVNPEFIQSLKGR